MEQPENETLSVSNGFGTKKDVSHLRRSREKAKGKKMTKRIKQRVDNNAAHWNDFVSIATDWHKHVTRMTSVASQAAGLGVKVKDEELIEQVRKFAAQLGVINQDFTASVSAYANKNGKVKGHEIPEYLEAMHLMTTKLVPALNVTLEEFDALNKHIQRGMAAYEQMKNDVPSKETKEMAENLAEETDTDQQE